MKRCTAPNDNKTAAETFQQWKAKLMPYKIAIKQQKRLCFRREQRATATEVETSADADRHDDWQVLESIQGRETSSQRAELGEHALDLWAREGRQYMRNGCKNTKVMKSSADWYHDDLFHLAFHRQGISSFSRKTGL